MATRRRPLDLLGAGAEDETDPMASMPVGSDDSLGEDALTADPSAAMSGAENPGDPSMGAQDPMTPMTGQDDVVDVDPTEMDAQQLQMLLEDPTTPPETVAAIQEQLAMAARRNLAGLG